MQQRNFQAPFKWPGVEYVAVLLYCPLCHTIWFVFQSFDFENKIEDFGRFHGAWKDYYDYSSPSELYWKRWITRKPVNKPAFPWKWWYKWYLRSISNSLKESSKISWSWEVLKQKPTLKSGGNLIVCPMTLLGQWKVHLFCFKYACQNGWFFRIYNDLCNLVRYSLIICIDRQRLKCMHAQAL